MYNSAFDPIDAETGCRPQITEHHYLIHRGQAFHAQFNSASVASSSTCTIQITTPASTVSEIHAYFGVSTNGPVKVELYEAPTVSGGAAITAYNRNRNSDVTATATLKSDPTIATEGTVLLSVGRTGSTGAGQTKTGGDNAETFEWELATGTTYIYKVTAGAAATAINAGVDWYEVLE
jgi:hypothetical protein